MDGPRHGQRFIPKQHYYVGGNTKVYGAILFRMRERDFGPVQHVDRVSPARLAQTLLATFGLAYT